MHREIFIVQFQRRFTFERSVETQRYVDEAAEEFSRIELKPISASLEEWFRQTLTLKLSQSKLDMQRRKKI